MKHLLPLSGLLTSLAALPALAQDSLRIDGLDVIGRPVDGETGFQPAVTELARDIHDLDHLIPTGKYVSTICTEKAHNRFNYYR